MEEKETAKIWWKTKGADKPVLWSTIIKARSDLGKISYLMRHGESPHRIHIPNAYSTNAAIAKFFKDIFSESYMWAGDEVTVEIIEPDNEGKE